MIFYLMQAKTTITIFKCEEHNAYTEQINKTALSSNDDKRLQT